MKTTVFEYDRIRKRLRELAFLNNGITIIIRDHRVEGKEETFHYESGIVEFVEEMNEGKQCILKKPIYITTMSKDKTGEMELAFQYNDGYNEVIHGYANNINTTEGGTHIEGFKKAPTIEVFTLNGTYTFKVYAVFVTNTQEKDDNGHVLNYIFTNTGNVSFLNYIEEIDKRKYYTNEEWRKRFR